MLNRSQEDGNEGRYLWKCRLVVFSREYSSCAQQSNANNQGNTNKKSCPKRQRPCLHAPNIRSWFHTLGSAISPEIHSLNIWNLCGKVAHIQGYGQQRQPHVTKATSNYPLLRERCTLVFRLMKLFVTTIKQVNSSRRAASPWASESSTLWCLSFCLKAASDSVQSNSSFSVCLWIKILRWTLKSAFFWCRQRIID